MQPLIDDGEDRNVRETGYQQGDGHRRGDPRQHRNAANVPYACCDLGPEGLAFVRRDVLDQSSLGLRKCLISCHVVEALERGQLIDRPSNTALQLVLVEAFVYSRQRQQ